MTFGSRLRKLRNEKGLTLREFADVFNIGKSTVSDYENDKRKPDYNQIVNFASYYGVTVDYLLCQTEERNIYKKKKKEYTKEELLQILDSGLIKDFDETKLKKIKFAVDMALEDISLDDLRTALLAIKLSKQNK